MDLKRLVSMRCSSCSQQRFLGDGSSSGIACPDNHIRHASFGSPSPPDRCRGGVSSATISTPLTHSEWAVCVIFILSSIFYKGQQGAPIIFPVQSQCKARQWQNSFCHCRAVAWLDEEKLAWSGFAARARFSYHKKKSEKDVRSSALFPNPWR